MLMWGIYLYWRWFCPLRKKCAVSFSEVLTPHCLVLSLFHELEIEHGLASYFGINPRIITRANLSVISSTQKHSNLFAYSIFLLLFSRDNSWSLGKRKFIQVCFCHSPFTKTHDPRPYHQKHTKRVLCPPIWFANLEYDNQKAYMMNFWKI